ncbi:MAG TPA: adenylate/guanylate cyclase domain-containing protein, partial [Flavisolibacter sp.]|nr:adenylate/guanylate cyclase domain-containing protein [Flavisolibacter sp.]
MHLQALQISEVVHMPELSRLKPILIIAVIFGGLYGIIFGVADYYLGKQYFSNISTGRVLIFSTIISFGVLVVLLAFLRLILVDLLMPGYMEAYPVNNTSWHYFLAIVVIYFFFMTLVINFINQVNKKYGRGVLLPLILGKYRQPREEERIFMFMDLKSSTTLAERLGHLKYSAFIRDSFIDINSVVTSYDADIYQYVSDEIVLSWRMRHGINNATCIRFYFACRDQFQRRSSYYEEHYGILPHFKAGVHGGIVTAVEVGNIKKDIAYHGDVLNTTARIQGLCNEYKQQIIISNFLIEKIELPI